MALRVDIHHDDIERAIRGTGPTSEPPAPRDGADAIWSLFVGAGWFRLGDWDQAARAFIAAEKDPRNAKLAHNWGALALARAGRFDEALARIDDRSSLRAEIACAAGHMKEGLAMYREVLTDDRSEWKALRFVHWLDRDGRFAEAGTWLDNLVKWAVLYRFELRAAAVRSWCEAGKPNKAWPHIEALHQDVPHLAATLAAHPSFERVKAANAVRRAMLARRLGWLPFGVHEALHSCRDVYPLSEEESDARRLKPDSHAPLGVLVGPNMWDALDEAGDYRPAAQVILRPPRSAYEDEASLIMVHPDDPHRLYLCLSFKIPAFLWPSAPASPAGLAALLAPYPRGPHVFDPPRATLTRQWGRYLGAGESVPSPYSGELELLDLHTFGRVAVTSPFLESVGWASADDDDPHEGFVDRGGLSASNAMSQHGKQHDQRLTAEFYRLRYSRGIVRLLHGPAGYALTVEYAPSPHPGAAEKINTRFGTHFPNDLPLDAIGVFMHFEGCPDETTLAASIEEGVPDEETWRLYGLGMLRHDRAELEPWLRSLPTDLASRCLPVAYSYNRIGWLFEHALTHEGIREPLQLGPHVSAMAGSPDDEDQDYDEDQDEDEDDL